MFLIPEATFAISVSTSIREDMGVQIPTFEFTDGGSVVMRTATGREMAKILSVWNDGEALYDVLPLFVVSGIDLKAISQLHPRLVKALVQEVMRRSRLSEVERGK